MNVDLVMAEKMALAILMFYSEEEWTIERRAEWKKLTRSDEITTEVLRNIARQVEVKKCR